MAALSFGVPCCQQQGDAALYSTPTSPDFSKNEREKQQTIKFIANFVVQEKMNILEENTY